MNNAKQLFVVLGLAVLALIVAGGIWYAVYAPNSDNATVTRVSIEEGSGVDAIGRQLEAAGVIRNATVFTAYARFSGNSRSLKAGIFVMPQNLSLRDVIKRLVDGEGNANDIHVTIPEGFTNTQVFNATQEAGLAFEKADFEGITSTANVGDKTSIIYHGKPPAADLSGYLFPDTYNFFPDSTAQEVTQKMVQNFADKVTSEMVQQIEASDYTFYELLTLASIVEKEVLTYEERRLAAGVFFSRLADNYPLQSDATLNFVTGKKETRASASDLEINSPYNSYANTGLPPTPISNPGIESIKAVLDPQESDYYFFLTMPDGAAIFSRNLDEHLQQKAIYYP